MPELTLSPGEQTKVVSQPGDGEAFNINVESGGTESVYLAHRSNGIVREGKPIQNGDRAIVSNLRGKKLHAKNPATNANDATITIDRAGFSLDYLTRPRVTSQVTQVQSGEGLDSFKHTTTGTTIEQLPQNGVPDGLTVAVRALESNTGDVFVGSATTAEYPLGQGDAVELDVNDTDQIHVRTPNAGDAIGVLFEDTR